MRREFETQTPSFKFKLAETVDCRGNQTSFRNACYLTKREWSPTMIIRPYIKSEYTRYPSFGLIIHHGEFKEKFLRQDIPPMVGQPEKIDFRRFVY